MTKYDALYQTTPHALGAPSTDVIEHVTSYGTPPRRVLDVGCGQGRDALFIARLGHRVTAIDLSPHGIKQLRADATAETLEIQAHVADICAFAPEMHHDVLLFDRVLHMLPEPERCAVLRRLLTSPAVPSEVLILDEPRNIPALRTVISTVVPNWRALRAKKGVLFAALDPPTVRSPNGGVTPQR